MPNPAILADGATKVVQAAEFVNSGGIEIKMDEQSKSAPDLAEDCVCESKTYTKDAITVKHRTISSGLPYALGLKYLGFKPSYATELVIGVDWEGDGCSVVGAKPFIKTGAYSSFGVDVRVSCEAQQTGTTVPPGCECCEQGVCVKWDVTINIDPPISPSARYSATIIVCANGQIGAEFK